MSFGHISSDKETGGLHNKMCFGIMNFIFKYRILEYYCVATDLPKSMRINFCGF